MKEEYFTTDNIKSVSEEMLSLIQQKLKLRNKEKIVGKTALLVLDMQDYFLSSSSHAFVPSAGAIIPGIKKLIEYFYFNDLDVIFTKHINDKNNAGMMSYWWNDFILQENELSNINQSLDFSKGLVIQKCQYDAFFKTNLEDILREKNIEQLVITGVMTHLCCESTIRSAFIRGFNVLFPIDGTATYNRDFHSGSFLNLSHGFAVPVLINDLMNSFGL